MTFGVLIAAIVAIGLVAAIMISRLEAGTGMITSHHQDKKGTPRGPLEEIKSNASVTENSESLALTGKADEKSESPALSKSAEVSEHDALIEVLKIQNEKLEALKFGGCLIQCALFGILCFLAWERFDKIRAAQAIRDVLN